MKDGPLRRSTVLSLSVRDCFEAGSRSAVSISLPVPNIFTIRSYDLFFQIRMSLLAKSRLSSQESGEQCPYQPSSPHTFRGTADTTTTFFKNLYFINTVTITIQYLIVNGRQLLYNFCNSYFFLKMEINTIHQISIYTFHIHFSSCFLISYASGVRQLIIVHHN
jgi:hypothetical protein